MHIENAVVYTGGRKLLLLSLLYKVFWMMLVLI